MDSPALLKKRLPSCSDFSPGSPRSPYPSPGPPTLLSAGLGPALASQRPPGTVAGTQGPARSKAQNQSPPTMWLARARGRDRRLRVWASPASAGRSEAQVLDPGSRPGPLPQPPAPPSGGKRAPGGPRPHGPLPAQQDVTHRARDSEFRTAPPPEVATSCSLQIGLQEKRAGPRAQIPRCEVLRARTPACSPHSSRRGPASPLFMSQLLGRASLTSSVPCMERLLVNICPPRWFMYPQDSVPARAQSRRPGHCARNEG